MKDTIHIGVLGCGTVGGGVVELLERRQNKIRELTGYCPQIRRVLVRQLDKPRLVPVQAQWLTDDAADILSDRDISVVIETIGGIEPARSYILEAISKGKHVVTANKDLMALHGEEILEAAELHQVTVTYEAAVGGAIPLIRPLKVCLTANDISEIKGIVNGTTNFILTRMTRTGASFDEALAEAQALGYAEANPSSDVDGLDAARKLVILASLAFHTRVSLGDVAVQGLSSVTAEDVRYADTLGSVIKLIAEGTNHDGTVVLQVRPTLIPKSHPLAHVSDANNALYVRGDAAGDLMFYGPGAGSLPTASAVVGDVIEVMNSMRRGIKESSQTFCLEGQHVSSERQAPRPYYLRFVVQDASGVFARIAGVFADADVSMETVMQKRIGVDKAEIVIVTHSISSHQVERVAGLLEDLPYVYELCNIFPMATEY